MKICPVGFMCFDKNTFFLIVVVCILLVVFFIHKNTNKFKDIEIKINNDKSKVVKVLKKLYNAQASNTMINEANFVANRVMDRIKNPLTPPEKIYPSRLFPSIGLPPPPPGIIPINIPTRGPPTGFQQVGVLVEDSGGSDKLIPLYGEQTYNGSKQWRYYTSSDGFQSVKLNVLHKNKNCMDEYGCDEIYDGNDATVNGYSGKTFKANIYKNASPRYIPYV